MGSYCEAGGSPQNPGTKNSTPPQKGSAPIYDLIYDLILKCQNKPKLISLH